MGYIHTGRYKMLDISLEKDSLLLGNLSGTIKELAKSSKKALEIMQFNKS